MIDKELSFEEQNDLALEMREHGASWKYIGLALDITPKSDQGDSINGLERKHDARLLL